MARRAGSTTTTAAVPPPLRDLLPGDLGSRRGGEGRRRARACRRTRNRKARSGGRQRSRLAASSSACPNAGIASRSGSPSAARSREARRRGAPSSAASCRARWWRSWCSPRRSASAGQAGDIYELLVDEGNVVKAGKKAVVWPVAAAATPSEEEGELEKEHLTVCVMPNLAKAVQNGCKLQLLSVAADAVAAAAIPAEFTSRAARASEGRAKLLHGNVGAGVGDNLPVKLDLTA
uniref:Uncharacterized protein n=1 Tax=Oryza punctata TaxID=4537 RepID=A0A0E0LE67_ORYPU